MRLNIQLFGGRGASSSNAKIDNRGYDGKTRLQSVGEIDARKVSNLRVGDIIMYNYGSTAKVTKIEPSKSGKQFTIHTTASDSGYKGERKYSGNTLVGIAKQEAKDYASQVKLRFTKGKK